VRVGGAWAWGWGCECGNACVGMCLRASMLVCTRVLTRMLGCACMKCARVCVMVVCLRASMLVFVRAFLRACLYVRV